MARYFLLSFDDGSVYDRRFVELLNRFGIKGTFNLNSGLEDFVWYYEDKFPVRRQILSEVGYLYRGHEIASHSLHHHWLNSLTPPQISREIGDDCEALKRIFRLQEIGFGVPFTACGEREVKLIRKFVRYIRLSEFAETFALPADPFHIPIHALYHDGDIREKLTRFAESPLEDGLFVIAGHSYELEVLQHWEYMDRLLQFVSGFGFVNLTTMEFVNICYPNAL
jgi:peptidoglycan/xylan/chitin deacetylase (PgdA/CDA1 family)